MGCSGLAACALAAPLAWWAHSPWRSSSASRLITMMASTSSANAAPHTLDVRHCPGHTPGHVVFHSPEMKRAFVGDVLFAGSVGRTDFPGGDAAQLLASIRQRLWPMGDDTVFIPGHGPESSFGEERRHNPYVRG